MNTNSNTYTVIYTALVVVVVAALLAFVSQLLGPMQAANDKAETISQILTAAQFGEKESWAEKGNAATIEFYKQNVEKIQLVNENGQVVSELDPADAAVLSTAELKKQNYAIAGKGGEIALPVYTFNNGVSVVSIYGQGLWGPVWGYIAFQNGTTNIIGAYFDHESETPGLGGKIKDDPSFRGQFAGKVVDYSAAKPFDIVKGGAPAGQANAIDAITGATMTSKYLNIAINNWLEAYKAALSSAEECCGECCHKCECGEGECCGGEDCCCENHTEEE